MKIFGIEFFKKNETTQKIEMLSFILKKYSLEDIINLFYKVFENNKHLNIFEYQLNTSQKFQYKNLNIELVKFFNLFETFNINEFCLSKNLIKDFIWGENLIDANQLYTAYNYKYIKIGLYNNKPLCVRYNGLFFYEESIIGVDDDSDENLCIAESDNIFLNLIFEIVYSKYENLTINEFDKKILEELNQ